jgi:Fe2+ transport system protein FeoA
MKEGQEGHPNGLKPGHEPKTRSARRLFNLRRGESSCVRGIEADTHMAKRLADLGFIGGARVEMLRPGKPCLVRVNGSNVGLGWGHQARIVVDEPV